MLKKNIDTTKLIEIDRTKAKIHTGFYEFGSWNHYRDDIDIRKLFSFTLYTVEVKASNVFQ